MNNKEYRRERAAMLYYLEKRKRAEQAAYGQDINTHSLVVIHAEKHENKHANRQKLRLRLFRN